MDHEPQAEAVEGPGPGDLTFVLQDDLGYTTLLGQVVAYTQPGVLWATAFGVLNMVRQGLDGGLGRDHIRARLNARWCELHEERAVLDAYGQETACAQFRRVVEAVLDHLAPPTFDIEPHFGA